MTFEEFLTKKKIDPVQLQTAEPSLFSEFRSHYSQMGEKSFDHSKKFWFNKLRRSYHLKEEPKPVPVKEIIEVNQVASQAEPLLSPTVEATVYTPRFKAKPVPSADSSQAEKAAETESSEKPAYKPRFKAPVSAETASLSEPATEPFPDASKSTTAEQPKPAFKPRFKAGLTNTPEPKPDAAAQEAPVKSAYVPRFKAQTPPSSEPAAEKPEDKITEDKSAASQETPAKPAYVPRFKAQIPPPSEPDPADKPEDAQPKPSYKPRFKPSMVKPKDEEG